MVDMPVLARLELLDALAVAAALAVARCRMMRDTVDIAHEIIFPWRTSVVR